MTVFLFYLRNTCAVPVSISLCKAPFLMAGLYEHHHTSADARLIDSWIEIASQPSSSSLSSAADEIVTTGLRLHQPIPSQHRRRQRARIPSRLNVANRAGSVGAGSSQEEYEESESEDDHAMTSSGEALTFPPARLGEAVESSDEDENRTAVNYPINNDVAFTPQPNAFSHPSATSDRHVSRPVPDSYFPAQPDRRRSARHSYPSRAESRVQHSPFNLASPSYNAAADHEAALRASLSTLQSFAAAARGLPKSNARQAPEAAPPVSNRIQPNTLRMVPASALENVASPPSVHGAEPAFKPTIRRASTSTSASVDVRSNKSDARRRGPSGRSSSKERRAVKKRRNSAVYYSGDDMAVSPTLFTWVVSVGVVVVFSAISFSAGYSMGKEAGRFESGITGAGDGGSACAREAGKGSLGLRRLRWSSVASGVSVGA